MATSAADKPSPFNRTFHYNIGSMTVLVDHGGRINRSTGNLTKASASRLGRKALATEARLCDPMTKKSKWSRDINCSFYTEPINFYMHS